jgi:ubiquinone/menaquinone biosynthesis C-methylase UbiE
MTPALHSRIAARDTRAHQLKELTYAEQRAHVAERFQRLLAQRGLDRTHSLRIADIGCGKGFWLRTFLDWGVRPAGVWGIDVDTARLRSAAIEAPGAGLLLADCQAVPFRGASFDIVTQFTLFTSLLDPKARIAAANEMSRIVKPGGLIVWYDFFAPNPMNPRTRPIGRREIGELFAGCSIQMERITFAAPLARMLARVSPRVAAAANRSGYLATHYLALIEPGSKGPAA